MSADDARASAGPDDRADADGRAAPLLAFEGVEKHFYSNHGLVGRLLDEAETVRAVDGVSFTVDRGETVGIVGESGCGKSTLAKTVVRLVEPTAGHVRFDGDDVATLSGDALARYRGRVQMIFQDPRSSLNPRDTIWTALNDSLRIHGYPADEREERIHELLEMVGLSPDYVDRYPDELSGGQAQRVSIARALACDPELLIADEPTSALDASVQAKILDILMDLRDELGLTMLFISHNLKVVRTISDRIVVMYLGKPVEIGLADAVIREPKHPYTEALIDSIPEITRGDKELSILEGEVPDPSSPPTGCSFHTRCPEVMDECREVEPALETKSAGRRCACHLYE